MNWLRSIELWMKAQKKAIQMLAQHGKMKIFSVKVKVVSRDGDDETKNKNE